MSEFEFVITDEQLAEIADKVDEWPIAEWLYRVGATFRTKDGEKFEIERYAPILPRVVRCRDCKHYDRMNDDEGMCMVPDDNGDYARWMVDEDGFCYLGMRWESK